jgi:hypothetical protein
MSVWTTTGCVSLKPPVIQQDLLVPCPDLSKHEGVTGAEVLRTMVSWAREYNECSARHNALVKAIHG